MRARGLADAERGFGRHRLAIGEAADAVRAEEFAFHEGPITVIASEAKQSNEVLLWIASSLALLAMTEERESNPRGIAVRRGLPLGMHAWSGRLCELPFARQRMTFLVLADGVEVHEPLDRPA